jgi:IS4 transposase
VARQLQHLRTSFAQRPGLPFADLLPDDTPQRLGLTTEPIYTPLVTLQLFLGQVLDPIGSCVQAVARLVAWLAATGQPLCGAGSGGYCKARQRLPEEGLHALVRHTGRTLHTNAAASWRWRGRRVRIADGSTLTMPDTAANQCHYPQPDGQEPGLGFPMIRFVVLFCLATGAVLEAAFSPYRGKGTGEISLLRRVWDDLDAGDVLLGDRIFCSYFEIALLQQRGIDVVFRKHQSRRTDFRTGTRLGANDHRIAWHKPSRPEWLDEATDQTLPTTLRVRETRVTVAPAGFRVRRYEIITTLLDPTQASAVELGELYRQRWQAELDLRSLKQSLGLHHLRCRTPAMVRNELWVHLLAYNLIRGVMAQAALQRGVLPRELSFAGATQSLGAFAPLLVMAVESAFNAHVAALWWAVGTHRVGDRPGRVEPRAIKRRRRKYPELHRPRKLAQQLLLQQI